ncbi:neck protein [Listeria phage LIS04]|nr:neck protein [Listeria phage LIS04]
MKIEEYSDKILRKLGHPTVTVELDKDQLRDAVEDAFAEVEPYITDTQFITVPMTNRIDLSSYKVDFIADVYKSPIGMADITAVSIDMYFFGGTSIEDVMHRLNSERMALSLKDRMTYRWIDPYLYVDMAPPYSTSITVEYIPLLDSVENITSRYWISIILRLALANAKETLGRIRGKVRVASSPFEVDGDTLLSEAGQEKAEIRTALDERADIFYPTD